MQDLLQSFEVLSPMGLIPAAIALVAGLLLWCAGQKFLKWAFAIIGLALGAVIGWLIGDVLGPEIPNWIPSIILALIAGVIAAVASRFLVTIALAVVLGIGFPALTWTVADATGQYQLPEVRDAPQTPEDVESAPDSDEYDADWIREGLERLKDLAGVKGDESNSDFAQSLLDNEDFQNLTAEELRKQFDEQADRMGLTSEEAQEQLERARTFLRELSEAARDIWDQAPTGLQRLLVVTSALGVLLGFVLGIFLPKLATAIVTSFGGSMLWMLALLTITGGLGAPLAEWLPSSMEIWTGAWLVISVIGLMIQWAAFRKKTDKSE